MAKFESIIDVKKHLEGLKSLSELKSEDYALEGGIAETIARQKGDMKFTQLRKFFGHIKKLESTEIKGKKGSDKIDPTKLFLLMPELAYGVGRGVISEEFYDVMKICLSGQKIKTVGDFKQFIQLLTAVIAYNKMFEKK